MINYKELLCGHMKEIYDDAANQSKNVLQKTGRNSGVHHFTRPSGSHVLVNVSSQKSRRETNCKVRPNYVQSDPRGDYV